MGAEPQIGAGGLFFVKYGEDGSLRSSVDKFYSTDDLQGWVSEFAAEPGDLMLILAGDAHRTRKALGELRIEMGNRLGLRKPGFLPHCGLSIFRF